MNNKEIVQRSQKTVVIKGFEMPESCDFCPMLHDDLGMCKLTYEYPDWNETGRPKFCPLEEIEDDGTRKDRQQTD